MSFIDTPLGNPSPADKNVASGLGADLSTPMGVDLDVSIEGQEGDETPEEEQAEVEFGANLAEGMDQGDLDKIGREIVELVDIDDRSRDDWKKTYIRGLDLLGFKLEDRTEPWSGACGVYHPVLTEAVVRFQAQAIMEIFPADGPAKCKVIGKDSREKAEQARRVQTELNYFACDKMTEFRPETETLLFHLALAGCAIRKTYFCTDLKRPVGRFIAAEDFIVPYGTTDLYTAPRFAEVKRMFPNDLKKMQANGTYLDLDLPKPQIVDRAPYSVQAKYDKLEGRSRNAETDERYELVEVHCYWDMPGFEDPDGVEMPYVVTIDRPTSKVLAIRRNWEETDETHQRRCCYTAYHYLPGLGFYGSGLIHLIGGITMSATSILRQLVDAGTLSNLPGGMKTRGMRIKGDDSPIMPGEFRDVDVPSGAIRDNIAFLPYKEPSEVLHSLLNDIIAEGRRLGAAPDLPANAMNMEAPVGTTLALLERSMKVMSAVQARLHNAMKNDLRLIAEIIREDMPPRYEYETSDPNADRANDFGQVDIIPVSDPNASSEAQRVVRTQAAIELGRSDPTAFDMPELYRNAAQALNMPDRIVKDVGNIPPMDPVSENMAIITGKPTKAFIYQDHEAHIAVHMAATQDPKIMQMVGQSPQANNIQGAMSAHISEHLAFAYRAGIEEQMGVPLPPPEEPLPEDVEVQLSRTVAVAAKRLLQKDQQEVAADQAQQAQNDPVVQLQMREVAIKEEQVKQTGEKNKAQVLLDVAKLMQKDEEGKRKLSSQERVAGAALGVDIAKDTQKYKEAKTDRLMDAAIELGRLEQQADQLRSQERIAKGGQNVQREQAHLQAESARQQVAAQRAAAAKKPSNGSTH